MSSGPEGSRLRYLTVAEVAETMRVSKMTVYRLAQSGDLPAVRVGRSYRVPMDALEAFLAASPAPATEHDSDTSRRSG